MFCFAKLVSIRRFAPMPEHHRYFSIAQSVERMTVNLPRGIEV